MYTYPISKETGNNTHADLLFFYQSMGDNSIVFLLWKIFHLFIQENIQKCHLGNFFKGNYSWDKSSKTPESVFEYIVTLYFEMDTMKKIFLNGTLTFIVVHSFIPTLQNWIKI